MKPGIQEKQKNPNIKQYGCYFLCVLRMAELHMKTELSQEDIDSTYDHAVSLGFMDKECYLLQPANLFNYVVQKQVYTTVRSVDVEPLQNQNNNGVWIICNKKPMYTHFTLHTPNGIFDPLPPERPGAEGYKPASFRVFE